MARLLKIITFCFFGGMPLLLEAQSFLPFFLDNGNSHQYAGGIYGCGATFCDFDKDGWDDLSLPMNGSGAQFYRNVNGAMVSFSLPIQNEDEIKHLTWVDYDNDGDRDLCMTGVGMPVRLFNNGGTMNLTEVSELAGFTASEDMTYGNSWGDYDRDGDLDVFIAKYDAEYAGMTNADNELYRNNGDGTFTNVATEAGIDFEVNYTFMGLWMDYDNDMWPDLLITNDRTEAPNYMFHNNGDGTFTDVSQSTDLDDYIWSMSNTCGDYDNDGDADLYITNGPLGNKHKQNNGNGLFLEVSETFGTKVNKFCWSAQFVDVDNDGFQDLHVCSTPIANITGGVVFMKNAGTHFVGYTEEAGLADDTGWSRGSAVGDVNNDGFPDIIVTKTAPDYSSFSQAVPNENQWLKVNLTGTVSNIDGIGSRIECYAGNDLYTRFTHCGESYNAQNSFSEFFGMGDHAVADSMLVYWPSGIVDKWQRIPAGQTLRLIEGTSSAANLIPADDILFCEGNDTTISVAGVWGAYNWFSGATTPQLLLDTSAVVFAEVTDAHGNMFLTDSIQVFMSEVPLISGVLDWPSCFGDADGAIELSGILEDDVVSVVWLGNDGLGLRIEGLVAGSYTYALTTQYDCFLTNTIELPQPDSMQIAIVTTDNLCAGGMDATALIQVTGGTPEYVIDAGANVDLAHLASGNYVAHVSDINGCAAAGSFFIDAPDEIVTSVFTEDVLCSGDSDGSVMLTISGGTGTYDIDWNGTDSLNLPAGQYAVDVQDSNGCHQTVEFNIEEPEPLIIGVNASAATDGMQNGSAILNIGGGVLPYSIVWSHGALDVLLVDSLGNGFYDVEVIDGNGCSTSATFEVEFVARNEQARQEAWNIYPNPSSRDLVLKTPGSASASVIISDQSGRIVLSQQLFGERHVLSIEHLLNGNYTVVLKADQMERVFNFIKL
jgi:hypothetical protein